MAKFKVDDIVVHKADKKTSMVIKQVHVNEPPVENEYTCEWTERGQTKRNVYVESSLAYDEPMGLFKG